MRKDESNFAFVSFYPSPSSLVVEFDAQKTDLLEKNDSDRI